MAFRPPQIIAAVTFLCLLSWLGHSFHGTSSQVEQPIRAQLLTTDEEHSWILGRQMLQEFGIQNLTDPSIEVVRMSINAVREDYTPPLVLPLGIKLPTLSTYNMDEPPDLIKAPISKAGTIKAPLTPPQVNGSSIIFGVATTIDRLEESLPVFAHWSAKSNTKIIALLQPVMEDSDLERVESKVRDLRIPLKIIESNLDFNDRYFTLLKTMYENRQPTTQWYAFIDDDTFFLSFPNLLTVLAKYDPSKPYYVGGLTEDFVQMAQWGFMAYGGAGIFLSSTLVTSLLPHFNSCFAIRNTGDKMLATCIYQHTTTKLTWEHSLHQIDLHGSHAGFYEALRPQPVSVHHWKSEDFQSSIDMYGLSLVAKVCGDACLLQKYKFKDDWILTNGYSLVKYSHDAMTHRDINTDISMERTWYYYGETNDAHFEHSLAPLREPDPGKISYMMESAIEDSSGRVRQLYVRRDADLVAKGVVEVIWSSE